MWHDHDIDFVRWLHPVVWHVDLESWQWIHQVAAPCNVNHTAGCCHIMWYVALGWHAIEFAQTSAILEFYIWFPFPHITAVDMSLCISLRNFIQIGPPSAEKMTSCRFSTWRISAILDFRGPVMGSLRSPCATSYRSSIDTVALNWLVFEKIAFFCILATDRQTDKQMDIIDAWSRSLAEGLTRSSAVAERPRDASCHWIFC